MILLRQRLYFPLEANGPAEAGGLGWHWDHPGDEVAGGRAVLLAPDSGRRGPPQPGAIRAADRRLGLDEDGSSGSAQTVASWVISLILLWISGFFRYTPGHAAAPRTPNASKIRNGPK